MNSFFQYYSSIEIQALNHMFMLVKLPKLCSDSAMREGQSSTDGVQSTLAMSCLSRRTATAHMVKLDFSHKKGTYHDNNGMELTMTIESWIIW